ncbi:MAG TPA: DUF4157 domain-containing protein [Candidatus Acidoferrales bacterium]|nr:DUF4157 domain-containing protein [Candidatus Acidoferrales bacterium]
MTVATLQREASTGQDWVAPAPARRGFQPAAAPHPVARIAALQQTFGNQATQRFMQRQPLVSEPGDPLEREADRVAEHVTAGSPPGGVGTASIAAGAPAALQRACSCGGTCAECQEEDQRSIRRKAATASSPAEAAPPIVDEVLRSPGQPLDSATRAFMESRFGHDFSRVRVHADAQAAESARAVSALAYTVGSDLVFNAGQFAPTTGPGRRLLAHELTHVVQQTNAGTSMPSPFRAATDGVREKEAGRALQATPSGEKERENLSQWGAGAGNGPLAARLAPAGILQRQFFLPPVQSGGFGGAMERDRAARLSPFVVPRAPTAMPAIPVGSPYSGLPSPLLETLWRSYSRRAAGMSGSAKNIDNAFWGSPPKDFWEALDRLARGGALTVIQQIYGRWTSSRIFWGHLAEICAIWGGTTVGFDFNVVSVPGLSDQLAHSAQYCQDVPLTGGLYHFNRGETPCWRERVSCAPGLHFCLGRSPASIHIDPTQVVEKRESDGTCNYDLGCVYGHFKDLGWVP